MLEEKVQLINLTVKYFGTTIKKNYMKLKFIRLNSLLLFVFGAMFLTGCLKDNDFEDGTYGINNPGSPKGVLFQQSKVNASGIQVPVVAGISGISTPQTIQTLVKIAADQAVSQDLEVTVTLNNALLDGTDLTALDASYYTLPSGKVVIPAGEKYAQFVVTIPDAAVIDPSVVYGLGFTITEVSGSDYTVASNSKDFVFGIAIKNIYDGNYHSTGYVYHPSAPRGVDEDKVLPTVDANTVECFLGDLGTAGYVAWLTVDPETNHVTITAAPGAAGAPYTQFDDGLPTTNPGYTPQWDDSSLCNNTYDPATGTFYLRYGYVGSTGWRVTEEILTKE